MTAFANPPAFAAAMLDLLLPAGSREMVSGDLLEEIP
jgi:hypothetical protein